MDEFEFLRKMYFRLYEMRSLQAADEKTLQPIKDGRKLVMPHSAYETAALVAKHSIIDYLEMKKKESNHAD